MGKNTTKNVKKYEKKNNCFPKFSKNTKKIFSLKISKIFHENEKIIKIFPNMLQKIQNVPFYTCHVNTKNPAKIDKYRLLKNSYRSIRFPSRTVISMKKMKTKASRFSHNFNIRGIFRSRIVYIARYYNNYTNNSPS